MKKLLLIGVLTLVILIPLTLTAQVAFSNPGIAPGVLAHVYYSDGTEVPYVEPGGDGRRWIVVPGESYYVNITNVELPDGSINITVWIKGKTTSGIGWTIELTGQSVSGGEIITDVFQIPENAGCTIVVAYWRIGHLAQDVRQPGTPGHMKTYYDDEPPFDNPVPCEAAGVPEFTLGSSIVVLLGLLAAYVVRRRQKML